MTAGFLVWARGTYGVWGTWQTPAQINLCDQVYTTQDGQAHPYAQTVGAGPETSPIVVEPALGRLPLMIPQPERYQAGAGFNGCGSTLLLHLGPDAYVEYHKHGGP